MPSTCCILGAGFSHAAGLPLTKELFTPRKLAVPSLTSERRFRIVQRHYKLWLRQNPCRNPEEYLADLHKCESRAIWMPNKKHLTARGSLDAIATVEKPQRPLPFCDFALPAATAPPYEWAVELLGAVLATPLSSDTTATNFRYGARATFPFRCDSHSAFWREVIGRTVRIAAITTNYDILIERGLRHRPMKRTFGPGCYYGGIPRPQLLRGTQLPWAYRGRYVELDGSVPVYKLHGSLNWSRSGDRLELFQDLRPAFRRGGDAAIIPPLPEKEIPAWLEPVWSAAERELVRAATWIVCGYSMPAYDVAVSDLLQRAATVGNLKRVFVLDPNASDICCRYSSLAQNVEITALPALPDGISMLSKHL